MRSLLADAGFSYYNNWVKLFREAVPLAGIDSDLRVVEIDCERSSDFARIVASCFEWDERLHPWLGSIVGRRNWHHYIALDKEKPVATGSFFVIGEYAWIDFAATLSQCRGKGAQAALMQRRIDDAISLGCTHLVVETAEETPQRSAPSYRNMIRYGFRQVYVRPNVLYEF